MHLRGLAPAQKPEVAVTVWAVDAAGNVGPPISAVVPVSAPARASARQRRRTFCRDRPSPATGGGGSRRDRRPGQGAANLGPDDSGAEAGIPGRQSPLLRPQKPHPALRRPQRVRRFSASFARPDPRAGRVLADRSHKRRGRCGEFREYRYVASGRGRSPIRWARRLPRPLSWAPPARPTPGEASTASCMSLTMRRPGRIAANSYCGRKRPLRTAQRGWRSMSCCTSGISRCPTSSAFFRR